MSSKQSTIWPAEPHTIAKIEMLRSYLFQWFAILGRRFTRNQLWYIDGFAGPGEYTNYSQGSPIAAVAAANSAMTELGANWIAGDVHCLFVEEDKDRFAHLQGKLASTSKLGQVHVHSVQGTFREGMDWLKKLPGNPFQTLEPVFAFIDPFGPSGLSFSQVKELMSRPGCEVLINLDSDGIGRINLAGENANHRQLLNEIFGDSSWEAGLKGLQLPDAIRRILALYKERLLSIQGVRYAFSFEMRKKNDTFDYHLVFACRHPLGLEKMKEVMKRIDQSGAYCFSDDHVGQQNLFDFDDPESAAALMQKFFAGKTAGYGEVNDYALNHSPYPNPKSMLKCLEKSGRVVVNLIPGARARKKNTYPEELYEAMRFRF